MLSFLFFHLAVKTATSLGLHQKGLAVLGTMPAGLPKFFHVPLLDFSQYKAILRDAAGLALVSFTSGILTAKSFAQRNRYAIDANRELIGFGACNRCWTSPTRSARPKTDDR